MAPDGRLRLPVSASSPGVAIVTLSVRPMPAYDATKHCTLTLSTVADLVTAPIIIPVSELRRDVARLIEKANRSPDPFFITQRGYITAVLLSPQMFEDLRDAGRTEQERSKSPRRLDDRRVLSVQYGPGDWETARLTDDEQLVDDQELDE
jgi:prevent-host-death family protein